MMFFRFRAIENQTCENVCKKDDDPVQKPWHNVSIALKQAFYDELNNMEKGKLVIKIDIKHMQT